MLEDRTNKVKTNDMLEPKNSGYKSLDEAIADFKTTRMSHIKYMKTSTEDMRNHVGTNAFWLD